MRSANAHLTTAIADAPRLEFLYGPSERGLDRRDDVMAEPLRADAEGWIVPSDAPGMGHAPDEAALERTRTG